MIGKPIIEQGMPVDIVIEADYVREVIRVRHSEILEVTASEAVLAQTTPPLAPGDIGKNLIVTYTSKHKDGSQRLSFAGRVTGIEKKHPSGGAVILLNMKPDPKPFNLRMHYRVAIRPDSNVALLIDGTRVELLDLSLGGAKFSLREAPVMPKAGEIMKMALMIDRDIHPLEGEIIRIWSPGETEGATGPTYGAVKFLNIDRKLEGALGRMIMMIERRAR